MTNYKLTGKKNIRNGYVGKAVSYVAFFLFIFTFFLNVQTIHSLETVDRIVAVVNDEIITLTDLQKAMAAFEKQVQARGYLTDEDRKALYEIREKILDKLIDEKLTDQEIDRLQLKVTEKEIDEAIEQIKSRNFLTDEELRAALAQEGLTLEGYRDDLKKELLRPRLINYEVKSKIIITDEDIQSYYDKHKETYAGFKKYHIWNLVARPSSVEKEAREQIEKLMGEAAAKLKEGVLVGEVINSFSSVSPDYSGGDLGLYQLDELSGDLKKAISGLSAGECTGMIDTPNGFQLLYIEEIVDIPAKKIDEVSDVISEKLYSEVVDEKFKSWLKGLREKAHIKIVK